ncbi:hypothetical protein [Alkalicoccobacillus murimartini]|uniref:Uncharacterized protein n=1 Tax=Alkalicoccobacillus murimartini TaxID=171685 RepID=A0ABT9YJ05_9BACI|nr:hypothetical protein [Alkalicoccobacillus murimartini]MDQ0207465.1 hypothetical protein [Alkalicoccobacillus murimartini]
MKVYYEELDGNLLPQWLLLPAPNTFGSLTVNLSAPFERMEAEDFHDELTIVTITQAALAIRPADQNQFILHTDQASKDLEVSMPADIDYYLIRLEDLEEVLQMNVRSFFNSDR